MDKQLAQFVLVDFGLATKLRSEKILYLKCGTPGFIAPEIFEVDHFE